LPDTPTVGEFVPGFEASNFNGIGAPKNTPAEIIAKLNQEVNATLDDPRMKARRADIGSTVLALSPADFGSLSPRHPFGCAGMIKRRGFPHLRNAG